MIMEKCHLVMLDNSGTKVPYACCILDAHAFLCITITGSPGDLLGTSPVGSFPPVSPCDHRPLEAFPTWLCVTGPNGEVEGEPANGG